MLLGCSCLDHPSLLKVIVTVIALTFCLGNQERKIRPFWRASQTIQDMDHSLEWSSSFGTLLFLVLQKLL